MSLYLYSSPRRMTARWTEFTNETAEEYKLSVNLRDDDDAYHLSAPEPGLKAKDLNIQILDDIIRIEGEYQAEDDNYLVNELPSGSFSRTLRLPAPIEADRVEAHIADGILNLRLPKAESARPKKIKITAR
jgi:HSP20 family protein